MAERWDGDKECDTKNLRSSSWEMRGLDFRGNHDSQRNGTGAEADVSARDRTRRASSHPSGRRARDSAAAARKAARARAAPPPPRVAGADSPSPRSTRAGPLASAARQRLPPSPGRPRRRRWCGDARRPAAVRGCRPNVTGSPVCGRQRLRASKT
jgi:hypothetical protein